jgi:hypothetical protein
MHFAEPDYRSTWRDPSRRPRLSGVLGSRLLPIVRASGVEAAEESAQALIPGGSGVEEGLQDVLGSGSGAEDAHIPAPVILRVREGREARKPPLEKDHLELVRYGGGGKTRTVACAGLYHPVQFVNLIGFEGEPEGIEVVSGFL